LLKSTSPSSVTGPLLMLLSACLFTAMNLLLKQAIADFRVWDIGFYRFFGGLVILTAVFGRHGNPFRSPDTKLLLIRGCSGSIAFVAFIFSVRMLPVSTALMLLYSFPAFAAVFSAWLYHEKVSAAGWLCLVLVLVGVGLLVDTAVGGDLLGYLAGMVSAVFAGLTIAFIRRLKQSNGSVVIYLYFCAVGAAVTAPFFLQDPVLPVSTHHVWVCGGIVVTSILGQLTMNQGFGYCRSWEGGLYLTSEMVFTALAGIVLLGEPAGWRFWTGGALVLGSAVTVQVQRTFPWGQSGA
jgi:drug/metabolite transporter (DMT)-like permease